MPAVLVDTGPLVALLDRSDPYHLACQETLSSLDGFAGYIAGCNRGHVYVESLLASYPLGIEDLPRLRELMRKSGYDRVIQMLSRLSQSLGTESRSRTRQFSPPITS